MPRPIFFSPCMSWRPGVPVHLRSSCRARCRMTSSRSTSPAGLISIPWIQACAWWPICSPGPADTCPSGILSPSPAITCARPGPPPSRRSPSPWPTDALISKPCVRPASISRSRQRGSPSFLRPTITSSRRWRSSVLPAGSGPVCCREQFGVDSGALRFHAQTAGSTLTAQQAGEQPGPHRLAGALRHPRRRSVVTRQRIR